ncbi:hypothetical protein N657DRAFT_577214 [Parathielavia appendiculata]|uniref:Uncharacterized protein n=1 Tax=Parathielavia appendiculata TaxID=2587402 RepID=A0AAN6TVW7_9PEZI|nr:hypothetical protein N657DRAFT_577214 [Parathielavia appendiculata]
MQRKGGRAPSGPLSRLRPIEQDPLGEYGLPSKGEKRLLSPKVQEAYYARIVERYLAFCTEAGDSDSLQKQFARLALTATTTTTTTSVSLPPHTSSASLSQSIATLPSTEKLSQVLSALRKLREALVASHRHDHFATQAYLFSIRLGILASSYETYYPSLLHLLRRHHQQRDHPTGTTTTNPAPLPTDKNTNSSSSLTSVELTEITTYHILDTACRRGDLAEAYSLYNQQHHHRRRLHHHSTTIASSSTCSSPSSDTLKLKSILDALTSDNWVAWRRLKKQVDLYRVKLMEFAEHQVREHTLRAFGRAYLSVPVGVLEEQTGCGWAELKGRFGVGWELEEAGGKVVIRKVR